MQKLDDRWYRGSHLNYRDDGPIAPGRPTRRFSVYDRKRGTLLGFIRWFAPGRQYFWFPINAALSADFNDDVTAFLRQQTRKQKEKRSNGKSNQTDHQGAEGRAD